MPAVRIPLRVRIHAKIDKSGGPKACWPWTGAKDKDGYGIVWVNEQKRGKRVSRFILADFLEHELAPYEWACHTCDNPSCCNPQHMFVGSSRLNYDDMAQKGRRGKAGPKPKLSDSDILNIRKRLTGRRGEQKEIAEELGVSRALINLIAKTDYRTLPHQP